MIEANGYRYVTGSFELPSRVYFSTVGAQSFKAEL